MSHRQRDRSNAWTAAKLYPGECLSHQCVRGLLGQRALVFSELLCVVLPTARLFFLSHLSGNVLWSQFPCLSWRASGTGPLNRPWSVPGVRERGGDLFLGHEVIRAPPTKGNPVAMTRSSISLCERWALVPASTAIRPFRCRSLVWRRSDRFPGWGWPSGQGALRPRSVLRCLGLRYSRQGATALVQSSTPRRC